MKNTFKHILTLLALVAAPLTMQAENVTDIYKSQNGVSTHKSVSGPNSDGTYTITLETFAEGTSALVQKATPVDVVLVLDVSGSMNDRIGGNNTPRKIEALKTAVNAFIDEIHDNDIWEDKEKGISRETALGNRISIIKFAGNSYYNNGAATNTPTLNEGNNTYRTRYGNQYVTWNATQVVRNFVTTTDPTDVTSLQNSVNALAVSGPTAADYGMTLARMLIQSIPSSRVSNKVVVFFTDGEPNHSEGFNNSVATDAIVQSRTIKQITYGTGADATHPIVYSVGLFSGNVATNVTNFMNYISSNYPEASAYNNGGNWASSDYYLNASGGTAEDLKKIFVSIAEASGGSTETIGTSTQVRDVVTSSFKIPAGTQPSAIKIYTYDIAEDASAWTNQEVPAGVTPVIGTDTDGHSTLTVEGFDYSKDDSTTGAGDGNWVGIRKVGSRTFWAGKKLVIQFNVAVEDDITGGPSTATNTTDSGVYIKNEDDTYTNINAYEVPSTTLPVNIKITKTGLRHGESATFEIERTIPKKDEQGNIVYNAIGKPVPDDTKWENFSKVILTNKGENGAEVVKTLLSLDPNYIYKVEEDDWGWAYNTVGDFEGAQTTSSVVINPFKFINTEKTNVPKHAEAVSINHFATSETGTASEEHYKSSKVESF